MNINHKLMENNITKDDRLVLINFLKKNNILTQSKNVKLFEEEWSKWLGVKYSVFVNSGSSSNLLSIAALKIINKNKNKNEIIVPPLTWSSDISSLLHYNFKPIFLDINMRTLSIDDEKIIKKINKKTAAVFLTHVQGFNGLSTKLINFLKKKNIPLIEDVCESHGATFKKKKLGSFGLISNFSFYYAHHLTTIEGGMICTNNKKIYQILLSLRSHGLVRELKNKKIENFYINKNKDLSKSFIFLYPAYNLRNTEIGAVLGRNQLKRLNKNIKLRNSNLIYFLKNINSKYYFKDFDLKGCSNYAFPLILKTKSIRNRDLLETELRKSNIEFRRGNAGGGNQIRQPYLKNVRKRINLKNFKNIEHVHFFGYYIGNFPTLNKSKIKKICNKLNNIKYKDKFYE